MARRAQLRGKVRPPGSFLAADPSAPWTPARDGMPVGSEVLSQGRARRAAERGQTAEDFDGAADRAGGYDIAQVHRRTAELLRAGWPNSVGPG